MQHESILAYRYDGTRYDCGGLVGFVAGIARQTVARNVTINNLLPGIFDSDAQHRRTASTTAAALVMCRYVSCWPAKLANGRSSAVADERTATETFAPNVA